MTGPPKCGKTTSSLDLAVSAQHTRCSVWSEPRQVFFYAVEGRLKIRDLEGIKGMDYSRFNVIRSEVGQILTAQDFLSIAEVYIREVPGSIHIIDSFSSLCTAEEATSEMDKMLRADGPKLLSKFCRKICQVIPVNKNIVIGITHLMGNPTGYGAAFKEKSGESISYQADVKLRATTFKHYTGTGDENGTPVGNEIEWKVVTSAIGPPGQVVTSFIRFGEGIDKAKEVINIASDIGLVKKSGAWYEYDNAGEIIKLQGMEKFRAYFVEHPTLIDDLNKKIRMTLGYGS